MLKEHLGTLPIEMVALIGNQRRSVGRGIEDHALDDVDRGRGADGILCRRTRRADENHRDNQMGDEHTRFLGSVNDGVLQLRDMNFVHLAGGRDSVAGRLRLLRHLRRRQRLQTSGLRSARPELPDSKHFADPRRQVRVAP